MSSETNKEQEVVIVLSSQFVSLLEDLASSGHVWAVRTPDTERVAHRVWDDRASDGIERRSEGLTLFTGTGDAEDDFLSIIDTVELHHGLAAGGVPAVNVVRVLGVAPTDAIRKTLLSLGFSRLTPTQDGFVAKWDSS
jgi:hypothetical protein